VGDLSGLRRLQRLLDEAFRVPGTRFRFGWDAIVGLIPWAGDLVTAIMGAAIVVTAHRVRVPLVVKARMLINLAIDLGIGIVPFAGDVADLFWKSNTKNMILLERHAALPAPDTTGDWWFVTGVVAIVFLAAAVPLLLIYWLTTLAPGPRWTWW
jgi:hypothetical protein